MNTISPAGQPIVALSDAEWPSARQTKFKIFPLSASLMGVKAGWWMPRRGAPGRPPPFLVKGVIIALKKRMMSMNQRRISFHLTAGNAGIG